MNVAIVGGGLAGLTAAYRLQQTGAAVTLFERSAHVGGRARTDEVGDYRIDAGAQLFASMYRRSMGLAKELGLGPDLVRASGRDALWRDGRAHEVVYGSVSSMVTSGALSMRAKLRLGATYVPFLSRHRDDLDLARPERAAHAGFDRESIGAWGVRELGEEFVEYLVQPQLASYYGSVPEQTSAAFYHILASHGMDVALYALRGGVGRLAITLAERIVSAGGTLHLERRVERVTSDPDGVAVLAAGERQRYDALILAIPAPLVAPVVSGLGSEARNVLEQVRYAPMITVALMLSARAGPRYFGLTVPRRERARTVSAIGIQENKGAGLLPDGAGLLVAYMAPTAVPELIDREPRDILERTLPEIDRMLPGTASNLMRARVYRWPEGNPVMYPGYLNRMGDLRGALGHNHARIALAGDYLHSPTMEGAISSGEQAAAGVLASLTAS